MYICNKLLLWIVIILFTVNKDMIATCTPVSYPLPSGSTFPESISFSPNGSLLASANDGSNDVTVFAVFGGTLSSGTSYVLPSGSIGPVSVTFSPDGTLLASANFNSNDVTVFKVVGGTLSNGISYGLPSGSREPTSIVFLPDGTFLATANFLSNDVTIFAVAGGVLSGGTSYDLPSGYTEPISVVFSPDGTLLAVADDDSSTAAIGDVIIFKVSAGVLSEGTAYALPSGSIQPKSVAFSPDGTLLAIANNGVGTHDLGAGVAIFTVSSGVLSQGTSYVSPASAEAPASVAFSPAGSYLAAANSDSSDITLFNVSGEALSGRVSYVLPSGSTSPLSVTFSPDGAFLATANQGSNDVTIFTGCFAATTAPPMTTIASPQTTVPTSCVPAIPPAPAAVCNGTNWIVSGSTTVSKLEVSDQTPLIVVGSLTLEPPNCLVTVDASDNGTVPIIVQNTVDISPDCSLVVNVNELPNGPVPIIQAAGIQNGFASVSFVAPSGNDTGCQTTSDDTLFALLPDSCGGTSTSVGKIAGIAVGSVVGAALVVGGLIYISRKIQLPFTRALFRPTGEHLEKTYNVKV